MLSYKNRSLIDKNVNESVIIDDLKVEQKDNYKFGDVKTK